MYSTTQHVFMNCNYIVLIYIFCIYMVRIHHCLIIEFMCKPIFCFIELPLLLYYTSTASKHEVLTVHRMEEMMDLKEEFRQ